MVDLGIEDNSRRFEGVASRESQGQSEMTALGIGDD